MVLWAPLLGEKNITDDAPDPNGDVQSPIDGAPGIFPRVWSGVGGAPDPSDGGGRLHQASRSLHKEPAVKIQGTLNCPIQTCPKIPLKTSFKRELGNMTVTTPL